MARGDVADKSAHAQRLLGDPLLQDCFQRVEKEIVDALAMTRMDTDANEFAVKELVRELQANRRIRRKLHGFANQQKLRNINE